MESIWYNIVYKTNAFSVSFWCTCNIWYKLIVYVQNVPTMYNSP